MSRTLPESHELQRLADEMEMRRIEARLKDWNQKPTATERVATLAGNGWSLKVAWDDIRTLGWGGPTAYAESQRPRTFATLPDTGGKPSRLRPRPPRA